ncbi:hypothetical protein AHAS_Ahas19G0050200 [Arachis hypogaea]
MLKWRSSGGGTKEKKEECIGKLGQNYVGEKKEGGLGFKEFHHQNTAQLAKQAWRIIKNLEATWVQILKAIYFPNCEFWEAHKHQNRSWVWNSILQGRDLLGNKGKWSLGRGSKVRVWGDNWIHSINKPLKKGCNDNQKVEEFITNLRSWDKAKIHMSFPPIVANMIVQTPVSKTSDSDKLIWPYRKDGEYSTKTGYYAAKQEEEEEKPKDNPSTSNSMEELWQGI